jgi:hypothetical protein
MFAASQARLRNGKINRTLVGALTGLPRSEVKKLLLANGTNSKLGLPATPVDRILFGWLLDPRFRGPTERNGDLPVKDSNRSFVDLVRRYGRDITYRVALTELRRLGVVRLTENGKRVGFASNAVETWARATTHVYEEVTSLARRAESSARLSADLRLTKRSPSMPRSARSN